MLLNQKQKEAVSKITAFLNSRSQQEFGLEGRAGTGKTTVISKLRPHFPHSVLLIAPTHKALDVLSSAVGMEGKTYASALGLEPYYVKGVQRFRQNIRKIPRIAPKLIIADEASMLTSEYKMYIERAYPHSKVLYVGDNGQIPGVDDPDYNIFDHIDSVTLEQNMRSGDDNPTVILADKVYMNKWTWPEKSSIIGNNGYELVSMKINSSKKWVNALAELFEKVDTFIVFRNALRTKINKLLHKHYYGDEKYGKGEALISNTNIGYDGTKYAITNGEIIKVISYREKLKFPLPAKIMGVISFDEVVTNKGTVRIADSTSLKNGKAKLIEAVKRRKITWTIYVEVLEYFHDISYAYCITAHKSQGSTYNNVGVFMYDIEKAPNHVEKIAYTSLTRARNKTYLIQEA